MTGSTKDPENGPAVAASVFAAVVVYAVRPAPTCVENAHWISLSTYRWVLGAMLMLNETVLPRLLRFPSLPTCSG